MAIRQAIECYGCTQMCVQWLSSNENFNENKCKLNHVRNVLAIKNAVIK